jgi:hypothetical protein
MDLVALLDEADLAGALVSLLELLLDAERMEFARTARFPQCSRKDDRAGTGRVSSMGPVSRRM